MTNEQKKALAKIKKCLGLAASPNATEAETAFRQAKSLMDKYQLTYDDVAAMGVNRKDYGATVKTTPTDWENGLAQTVARAFNCQILFRKGNWNNKLGTWGFIGVGVKPELASYAFEVLVKQLKRDRTTYVKTSLQRCKLATRKKRAQAFCLAWVYGVYEKITALESPSAADDKAIAAYMAANHDNMNKLAPRETKGTRSKHDDMSAGFKCGQAANLNKAVGGDKNEKLAVGHG